MSEISFKLFGRRPSVWLNKSEHYLFLRFGGIEIQKIIKRYLYFCKADKTHSIRLKQREGSYSRDFVRGFAAGLVASDGSVGVSSRSVRFSVTSKRLVQQYVSILNRMGVHVRFYEYTNKHGFAGPYKMYTVETKAETT